MPTITIATKPSEQLAVYNAVKKLQNQTIPVTKIAKEAGLTHGRTRYALDDLIAGGYIMRTPTRQFNEHYVRYAYTVNGEKKLDSSLTNS